MKAAKFEKRDGQCFQCRLLEPYETLPHRCEADTEIAYRGAEDFAVFLSRTSLRESSAVDFKKTTKKKTKQKQIHVGYIRTVKRRDSTIRSHVRRDCLQPKAQTSILLAWSSLPVL